MSIEDIYKGLSSSIEATLSKSRTSELNKSNIFLESNMSFDSIIGSESREGASKKAVSQSFGVENVVRHRFGKNGKLISSFGCHPDFDDIDGTDELRHGYAITMFMDIIGSTKLGVTYSPAEVFRIKNDIIRCAIETIDAFDGHVHRIMGDAVMAFFRSNLKQSDGLVMDHAIDALNCAVILIEMIEKVVAPKLSDMGADKIGIRIGIDYGEDKDVIWGTYGYYGSHEVTATSYHVDVAAKLQQKAPKNSILVGENFVNLLGVDDDLKSVLIKKRNGEDEPQVFVRPNYITSENRPKNYKQFLLNHREYKKYTPINSYPEYLTIKAAIKKSADVPSGDDYQRCSRSIKKNAGVSFKATYFGAYKSNLKFRFRVENTGEDAKKEIDNGNHETFVDAIRREDGSYFAKHWECTEYKGIHHMFVSVWAGNTQLTSEERFSIFVTN